MIDNYGDLTISFHHEPSDPSVGIMADGFSAWNEANTDEWCEISNIGNSFETTKFQWNSNHTGNTCERPKGAIWIEKALYNFAETFYSLQNEEGPEVNDEN